MCASLIFYSVLMIVIETANSHELPRQKR
jgi:hypothetical protein